MEKRLFIYRIRHLESSRSYIGWTTNLEKRWKRHRGLAKQGAKNAIHCALRLYGVDAFAFEVLEELFDREASARVREIWWIANEGTLSPGGYNMTAGGDGAEDLGRLSAIATAKLKAADPEGFRAKRSEAQRVANLKMEPGARSARAFQMWANRTDEVRESHRKKCLAREAALSAQDKSERGRKAALSGTTEDRAVRARKGAAALTSDQRKTSVAAMQAALTPEMRSTIGKMGAAARTAATTSEKRSQTLKTRWARTTPEQNAARSRKISESHKSMSPERRADIARRRWETRRMRQALRAPDPG